MKVVQVCRSGWMEGADLIMDTDIRESIDAGKTDTYQTDAKAIDELFRTTLPSATYRQLVLRLLRSAADDLNGGPRRDCVNEFANKLEWWL